MSTQYGAPAPRPPRVPPLKPVAPEDRVYCSRCKHFYRYWSASREVEECHHPENLRNSYYVPKSICSKKPAEKNARNDCKSYEEGEPTFEIRKPPGI